LATKEASLAKDASLASSLKHRPFHRTRNIEMFFFKKGKIAMFFEKNKGA